MKISQLQLIYFSITFRTNWTSSYFITCTV